MSAFGALKNATVAVASVTGRDANNDPTYSAPESLRVRLNKGATVERENGTVVTHVDKITTDQRAFSVGDVVWITAIDYLPGFVGEDASDPSKGHKIETVGGSSVAGSSMFSAEF